MTEAMTDVEIFKASAEACGKTAVISGGRCHVQVDTPVGYVTWNPFLNHGERWECVRKLLEEGWHIDLRPNSSISGGEDSHGIWSLDPPVLINCPAEEFPARALAELHRRK